MSEIPVVQDEDRELPVPTEWRAPLKQIADALARGDFSLSSLPPDARYTDPKYAEINRSNIQDYPDRLIPLDPCAWDTSIYLWMEDYWAGLVDLTAKDGETSDLVLHVKVRKNASGYSFEPKLVYVP